ncbi:hypothetical protein M8J75_000403 [Diaphorina citri]|nr:hypothetical protein M8J75_000403 [Diaphorina citri]
MAIVPLSYPEEKMLQSCADTIGSYLCRQLFKAARGHLIPTFVKNDFEKGALVLVCRDDYSVFNCKLESLMCEESWHAQCDATFSATPAVPPYTQLFTLHAVDTNYIGQTKHVKSDRV